MESISVKNFIKTLMAQKGVSVKDLSNITGKSTENILQRINSNKLTLTTFNEIMEALEEPIKLELKNGNKYVIDINL